METAAFPSSRRNIYDQMIVVLIISSVFGYLGGFFTQPIIVFTIVFFPRLVRNAALFRMTNNKNTLIILLLLFIYAAVSILWSPNTFKKSLVLLIRASFHIIMCLEIIVFSQRAAWPLDSVSKGWVIAFLLTSVVAVWEMATDHHLMTIAHEDLESAVERHRAAVTFYNNNTYSLFVLFSLPFLLYRIRKTRTRSRRTLLFLCLLLLISIILLNASRAAFLSVGIMMCVYVFNVSRGGDKKSKRSALLLIVLVGTLLLLFGGLLLEALLYRTEKKDMFQDNVRMILWVSSFKLFVSSHGLGHGFGSMLPALAAHAGNLTTKTYSHNLLLELMLEGGVFFGGAFLIFLFRIFRSARKQIDPARKMLLFAVLLPFPLYSILNSEYLTPTFVWLFFVSVSVFAFYSGRVIRLKRMPDQADS